VGHGTQVHDTVTDDERRNGGGGGVVEHSHQGGAVPRRWALRCREGQRIAPECLAMQRGQHGGVGLLQGGLRQSIVLGQPLAGRTRHSGMRAKEDRADYRTPARATSSTVRRLWRG
jgi:hypothetical protein